MRNVLYLLNLLGCLPELYSSSASRLVDTALLAPLRWTTGYLCLQLHSTAVLRTPSPAYESSVCLDASYVPILPPCTVADVNLDMLTVLLSIFSQYVDFSLFIWLIIWVDETFSIGLSIQLHVPRTSRRSVMLPLDLIAMLLSPANSFSKPRGFTMWRYHHVYNKLVLVLHQLPSIRYPSHHRLFAP